MASLLSCLATLRCSLLEEGIKFVLGTGLAILVFVALVVRVLLISRRRAAVQLELVRAAERNHHVDGKRYAED